MAKAEEWTERVAEWRASGLKAKDFCVGRGYTAKSLWHWSSKLGHATDETPERESAVRLVRVKRQPTAVTPTAATSMVVEMEGARLMLQGRVDSVALRTVMATLRSLAAEDAQ